MSQSRPLLTYFHPFLGPISIAISIQIEKSIDGVLGIRTRDCRIVGTDETTELWLLKIKLTVTINLMKISRSFLLVGGDGVLPDIETMATALQEDPEGLCNLLRLLFQHHRTILKKRRSHERIKMALAI